MNLLFPWRNALTACGVVMGVNLSRIESAVSPWRNAMVTCVATAERGKLTAVKRDVTRVRKISMRQKTTKQIAALEEGAERQ